ncbi:MAG: hypothetical protein SVG88_07245 [Halobacteriales archaeon]|nr:hypothetical protein [Halobacteriales archaeon]
MVTLGDDVLSQYSVITCYNSPFVAHNTGCAIDLYPDAGAPSPVAGEVRDVRTVRAPPRSYAVDEEYLVLIDTGEYVARLLHIEPTVEPGEAVAVGDHLGTLVRSGFFAPWVDNHIHLGFREPDANLTRASGSLRIELATDLTGVPWDGTGRVIDRGATYVTLDAPDHPAPGECFAGVSADGDGVLDGGLPHYDGGGLYGGVDGSVSLLATTIGTATDRTVDWRSLTVRANGHPVTGLSFALGRDRIGVKLVDHDGIPVELGEHVSVTIEPH